MCSISDLYWKRSLNSDFRFSETVAYCQYQGSAPVWKNPGCKFLVSWTGLRPQKQTDNQFELTLISSTKKRPLSSTHPLVQHQEPSVCCTEGFLVLNLGVWTPVYGNKGCVELRGVLNWGVCWSENHRLIGSNIKNHLNNDN